MIDRTVDGVLFTSARQPRGMRVIDKLAKVSSSAECLTERLQDLAEQAHVVAEKFGGKVAVVMVSDSGALCRGEVVEVQS